VYHLVCEHGPFVSAPAQTRDAQTAIARALETIEADARPSSRRGEGGDGRVGALFHARMLDGLKRPGVTANPDGGDPCAFCLNVMASLVARALSGADAGWLAAMRLVIAERSGASFLGKPFGRETLFGLVSRSFPIGPATLLFSTTGSH
jgi:hypothetical protein